MPSHQRCEQHLFRVIQVFMSAKRATCRDFIEVILALLEDLQVRYYTRLIQGSTFPALDEQLTQPNQLVT